MSQMAHCSIRKHGPSGDIQRLEGVCALPLNVLNEKIYAALWVWFVVLTAVTVTATVYRIALVCSHRLRESVRCSFKTSSIFDKATL